MSAELKQSLAVYRQRVDLRLGELLPTALPGHAPLQAAMRDGVLAPGKRLRPLMTILTAEDLGGSCAPAMDAGCAIEMIHAASLVVDDLPCMDDATLRRGLAAVHIAHGEDLAVLVAIGALSAAYGVVAGIEALSPAARLRAVAVLSSTVGVCGLVGGQFADLREGSRRREVADITAVNGLKTGVLFTASVEIGAIVAGADDAARTRLLAFATELGAAFQLLDDLLDTGCDASVVGKNVGQDQGKSTIVAILGRPNALRRIERHAEAAHGALNDVFGDKGRLHGFVDLIFDQALGSDAPRRKAERAEITPAGQDIVLAQDAGLG